jgi:glycine oxidase
MAERVAVVGGGVIGCAVAERLARDGHQVTLFERDAVGAHASGAAAGLLGPHSESVDQGPDFADLGARSYRLFPELAARLERDTGISIEYQEMDSVRLGFDAPAGAGWTAAAEVRRLEPALSDEFQSARIFKEAQLTPPRFVRALAAAAVRSGAEIREGELVTAVTGEGIRLGTGRFDADHVVLAAGPWSAALAAVDVEPRRGQLVALLPRSPVLTRIVTWDRYYLVPKPEGTVVIGSTEEQEAGFDARPTAAGISEVLQVALRTVPALAGASVQRVWAGIRPATPEGLPIVRRSESTPNLVLATGHHRNGILLAPITAEIVSSLI